MVLDVIAGVLGGLGGLFGKKSKSSESFERFTDSTTEAETQDLSPELLTMLEGLFKDQVGGGKFEAGGDALSSRLNQLLDQSKAPQFDVNAFASGITEQATAGAQLDLESTINDILSASGSSETGNSMSALLANRLRNQTAANLAGISSGAVATGEGIRQAQQQQITEGILGLGTSLSDQILQLIQTTRGAKNIGTSTTKEHTKGTGSSSGSSKGNPFSVFGDIFGSFGKAREEA